MTIISMGDDKKRLGDDKERSKNQFRIHSALWQSESGCFEWLQEVNTVVGGIMVKINTVGFNFLMCTNIVCIGVKTLEASAYIPTHALEKKQDKVLMVMYAVADNHIRIGGQIAEIAN